MLTSFGVAIVDYDAGNTLSVMRALEPWVAGPLETFLAESAARVVLVMTAAGQVVAQHGFTRALDVMARRGLLFEDGGLLRTHPKVLLSGQVLDNPWYVDPTPRATRPPAR